MKLYNNTPNVANYEISCSDAGNCGTIQAQEKANLPAWDNQDNVRILFYAAGNAPFGETNPFSVTIPQTGKNTVVTIGLFQT